MINRKYSKWSVWIIATALVSLGIINYLFFAATDILFKEPFLPNVYLCFIILVEVFTGLSQNRILRALSYLLSMVLCGFVFIFTILNIYLLFFVSELISFSAPAAYYFILVLSSGILSFSAAISLLRLYFRADDED